MRYAEEKKGFTVWFTGLSGAGKSTLAELLFHELRRRDQKVELLDGDVVRTNLSKGLGFSKEDRDTNILRIGFVANLLTRNGVAAVVSAISPYRDARNQCRAQIKDFVEVYVHATVDECARRDVKGLYLKAMAGEITGFTGVDDPYEEPQSPELYIDTMTTTPDDSLQMILDELADMGYIEHNERLTHGPLHHSGMTDLDGRIGSTLAGRHSASEGGSQT
jgi:adenylyl-sulfate kinase